MTQQQLRGVIAIVLLVVTGFGIYLGWHFSHPAKPAAKKCTPEALFAAC